jgi:hypothetical protein
MIARTPKQKAAELVDQMGSFQPEKSWLNFDDEPMEIEYIPLRMAVNSALIVAESMLDMDCVDMSEKAFNKHIAYWNDVKQELNNLL